MKTPEAWDDHSLYPDDFPSRCDLLEEDTRCSTRYQPTTDGNFLQQYLASFNLVRSIRKPQSH